MLQIIVDILLHLKEGSFRIEFPLLFSWYTTEEILYQNVLEQI